MFKKLIIVAKILSFVSYHSIAQCPATFEVSPQVTDMTCSGNGSVVLIPSVPLGTGTIYTLLTGPNITVPMSQISDTFSSLVAGDYTAKVECGSVEKTVSFTIDDLYVPINGINVSVSTNCGNNTFQPGGTLTIDSVFGGNGVYQYAVTLNDNPDYPDNLSVYNSSRNFTVSSYGMYQVRVKDSCGNFFTVTKELTPSFNPLQFQWMGISHSDVCNGDAKVFSFTLKDMQTGSDLSVDVPQGVFDNGGFILKVYEKAAGSCAPATTNPILIDTINTLNFDLPLVTNNNYYFELTNPCGVTSTFCRDLNNNLTKETEISVKSYGCDTDTSSEQMKINAITKYLKLPIYYKVIRTSDNNIVVNDSFNTTTPSYQYTINIPELPNTQYKVVVSDGCGYADTLMANPPYSMGSPNLEFAWSDFWRCIDGEGTNQTGAAAMVFNISGYIPDYDNIVVKVISGPSNVGINAIKDQDSDKMFVFQNMVPGDYAIRLSTNCYDSVFNVTIPESTVVLNQSVTSVAESYCSGNGKIQATPDYNGAFTLGYILVDATTNIAIDSNYSGLFVNVVPGSYFVKLSIMDYCAGPYTINSNLVSITSGSNGPVVYRKAGITCEDIDGNPTTNGTAYLTIFGPSPINLSYRLMGDTDWITYDTNASTNEAISGLTGGQTYEFRVSSCGKTSSEQLTIGTLGNIEITNTLQPCAGENYVLDMPDLPGATYRWLRADNVVLSNDRQYTFVDYDKGNDGLYIGEMVYNNCIIRTDSIYIYSEMCSYAIGGFNISGNVYHDSNGMTNNLIDGLLFNNPDNQQLYATLLNSDNNIVTVVPVNADGSYVIKNLPAHAYNVVLTTNISGSLVSTLPQDWVNTAANNLNVSATNYYSGILPVVITNSNSVGNNFGIEKSPNSQDTSITFNNIQPIVGVTNSLSSIPLSGSDLEDKPQNGTWTQSVMITTLPTNGFMLYYDGQQILTDSFVITNYDPAKLTIAPSTSTPAGTNTTTFYYAVVDTANIADLTPAAYVVNYTTPLPIVLSNINAKEIDNCKVELSWESYDEESLMYYEIQQSNDGRTFNPIYKITPNGVSSKYKYIVTSNLSESNYFRLQYVDNADKIAYSNIANIALDCNNYSKVEVYPIPTNDVLKVVNAKVNTEVRIFDMIGREVLTSKVVSDSQTINVTQLSSGNYYMELYNNNGKKEMIKISKK